MGCVEENSIIIRGRFLLPFIYETHADQLLPSNVLGGRIMSILVESGTYNVNTLTGTFFYYCRADSTNFPSSSHSYFLLVFNMGSGNIIQIAYDTNASIFSIRSTVSSGASWSAWKSVTLT